jgi:hypothetical protein
MSLNISWDFNLLESLIQDRGDIVLVETGILCSRCNNNDTLASTVELNGRPAFIRSMSCGLCSGNGYLYRNARQVLGLVTSVHQSNNRQLLDLGYVSPGDAIFSPSLHADYIGDFDRITLTNPSNVDGGQVIMRGAATLDDNVSLETDLLPNQDRLWYLPESVQWCEDQHNIVYYHGTDFDFIDNKITWVNSPEVGTLYTIKYRCWSEWISYTSIMERFDQGRNLAQKVILKKKHVHFQSGSNAKSPNQRIEEQNNTVKI